MRKTTLSLLAGGAAVLCTLAARAEVYTIKLTSGGVFESRYEPKPATWDKSMLVFLDETGLQIALPKSMVSEVTAMSETKGFGRVLDTTTLDLGFMPNDMPQQGPNAPNPQAQLEAMLSNRRSYDQTQFVEPAEAGGGIPVNSAGGFFGGPTGNFTTPVPSPTTGTPPPFTTVPQTGTPPPFTTSSPAGTATTPPGMTTTPPSGGTSPQ
jgi:hypothetical protein